MKISQAVTSRRSWGFVLVLACLSTIYLQQQAILVSLAQWLDVGGAPRAVDYVMVLPGGSERRPFVAVAMLRAGLTQKVLTVQTVSEPSNDQGIVSSTADIFQQIVQSRGIQRDQIQLLPGISHTTWTDAISLSDFMRDHPDATVGIITDGFHTRRSRWVFQSVLGAQAQRVSFISAKLDGITPENWWKSERGLVIYLLEYTKLLAYVVGDPRILSGAAVLCLAILLLKNLRTRRLSIKKI